MGQKIVVLKRFQEELFLKIIQDFRLSNLWLAPPLVILLAKSPLVAKYDLSSVKEILSGAAPLSKDTEEGVKRRLQSQSFKINVKISLQIEYSDNPTRIWFNGKYLSSNYDVLK